MGNVFGEEKTMKQILREQTREINRAIRSLDQERSKLTNQEKKLVNEMKVHAKNGQVRVVKVMALDLIRIRKHQDKFIGLQAQLRAISLQMQTMSSTHALTEGMKSAAHAMQKLNAQLKLPALQKIMMEFARETESLEMKQEMIGDVIDDVMDTEEDVAESEEVVNQILDEIGISMNEGMVSVPSKPLVQPQAVASTEEQKDDADIVNRLNNLGR